MSMALCLVLIVLAACAVTTHGIETTLFERGVSNKQHSPQRHDSAHSLVRRDRTAGGSLSLVHGAVVHVAQQPDCPLPANSKWCQVTLGSPFSMAVYDTDDVVSNSICGIGTWELHGSDITAMGTPGHALDIGANMGFYSFVLAAAGWDVTAFEPIPANQALFAATLCKNPSFKSKITLNKVALGPRADHCIVVSSHKNIGDGQMQCGADAEKFENFGKTQHKKGDGDEMYMGMPYHTWWDLHFKQASMEMRRLDDILDEQKVTSIDFVKMDVEGFECNIMAGGQSLLTKFRPKMIQTEVWPKMQGCVPHDYLTSFDKASYTVADDRVCSHPDDLSSPKQIVDRFMCRKTGTSLLQDVLQRVQDPEQNLRSIVWLRKS